MIPARTEFFTPKARLAFGLFGKGCLAVPRAYAWVPALVAYLIRIPGANKVLDCLGNPNRAEEWQPISETGKLRTSVYFAGVAAGFFVATDVFIIKPLMLVMNGM